MLFFFFQAEDGIRDVAVTGVQTCALPISMLSQPSFLQEIGERTARACALLDQPCGAAALPRGQRSEEHTSELQSRLHLVCRLLLEKKRERALTRYRGNETASSHCGGATAR